MLKEAVFCALTVFCCSCGNSSPIRAAANLEISISSACIRTPVVVIAIYTLFTRQVVHHFLVMVDSEAIRPHFFGYPRALEGPTTTYHKKPDVNPVFRGLVLVYGAWMYVYPALTDIHLNILQCHKFQIPTETPLDKCWLRQTPRTSTPFGLS